MNNVCLMGRLTADPEVKGKKDKKYARYTLAVDRGYKDDDGNRPADFIRCVAFRGGADFADTYLEKGQMIGVIGSIRTGSYENEDGEKRYTTEVVVSNHFFAGSSGSDNGKKK